MKDGMNVVSETRIVSIIMRIESTAHFHIILDDHDLLAAHGDIAGTDHAGVPPANHNAVVFQYLRHSLLFIDRFERFELLERLEHFWTSASRSKRFQSFKSLGNEINL